MVLRSLSLALSLLMFSCGGKGQSLSEDRAVKASASILPGEAGISLRWTVVPGASSYSVQRRPKGATTWGAAMATLPGSATGYTDMSAAPGVEYEYKVARSGAGGIGNGYVSSGIALPPVEERGVLILVVESSLMAPLTAAIAQLEDDLLGDGWFVERLIVDASDAPSSVRAQIAAAYAADPTGVRSVYLLGHVPVPYSGSQTPDGHGYHSGAWACDGYYGELDGNWTDATVNSVGSNWAWNHNVPGDGKFDQNSFPSALELQVGRVDLSRLGAFPESEVELLEGYLAKAHAYKTAAFRVPERAVIWDNLQWTGYPLAVSAHMSMDPVVGADSVLILNDQLPFALRYQAFDDLMTFQAGAGILSGGPSPFLGTENGMSTTQLSNTTRGGVFNMSIGSYFGDWDNPDNFLRALLAKGNALAHVWSGLPNWFLHPMALGEPIGYCALRTLNNTNSDYTLANGGWQGQNMGRVHLGLMGDPSVRVRYTAPPTGLVATNQQWYTTFSWQPSPDTVDGYLIYRIDEDARALVRITPEPVLGTSYTTTTPFEPGVRYMVRAIRLLTTPSGSYHDLSLGAMAFSSGVQLPDCAGVVGGGALPGTVCDDGDPTTIDAVYDLQCVCASPTIGIDEREGGSLRMWPSPANDRLHVQSAVVGGVLTVRSITGAEVWRQRMESTDCVVNTATWNAGTYFVEWMPPQASAAPARVKAVVLH
jgi:hypothetical protein